MWENPYVDCMCTTYDRRARFDMDTSHLFPLSMLATITLEEGGARAGCKAGLTLFSVAVTALSGARSDLGLLEQKL